MVAGTQHPRQTTGRGCSDPQTALAAKTPTLPGMTGTTEQQGARRGPQQCTDHHDAPKRTCFMYDTADGP